MIWPHTPLPDHIQQPGPDGPDVTQALTGLVRIDTLLPAGLSLHDSLAALQAEMDLKGATVRVRDAAMDAVKYVIPGLAPDNSHVAYYSDTYVPDMPGRIIDAAITCGRYNGQPFYHCHGILEDAHGTPLMGHLFPETCLPSEPVRVTGLGFTNATFSRVQDPQTGFELFKTEQSVPSEPENGVLLRIGPNVEISAPLIDTCRNLGWQRAEIHGVGSIIGAHFDDGRVFESFATELMVESGRVDLTGDTPKVDLDIALVGLGADFHRGRLVQGRNPVLITAEIVLKRLEP
ncbi:MAG TPA: hypothetical protein ENK28_07120 [Aliiroseovarius sp.]|nr:hypothetical protein [Aliiroseovarius sp.]